MSAEWVKRIASGRTASFSISATPSARWRSRIDRMSASSRLDDRPVDGVDEIVPHVGDHAAQRVGDARQGRHQHARQAEFARQRRGMQRTGAAEGEQGEVARIVAARHRDHADRARHLHVAEPQHRARGGKPVEAGRPPDLLLENRANMIDA